MEKENNITVKYEFLAKKSYDLLQEQKDSFTIIHGKAGSVAAISAILITFFLFIIDFEITANWIIYLSFIPLLLISFSFYYLLKILVSKTLMLGFKREKLDELIKMKYNDVLLFEMGSNKKSFIHNEKIVETQNNWFKKGIKLTTIVGIILLILIILSQFEIGRKKIETKNEINLNNKEMNEKELIIKNQDTNQDNDSTSLPSEPIEQENSQDTIIPDVPLEDLEPFEKGDDSEILNK